jgi:hypothetical protein
LVCLVFVGVSAHFVVDRALSPVRGVLVERPQLPGEIGPFGEGACPIAAFDEDSWRFAVCACQPCGCVDAWTPQGARSRMSSVAFCRTRAGMRAATSCWIGQSWTASEDPDPAWRGDAPVRLSLSHELLAMV